jgi:hypothetical protein
MSVEITEIPPQEEPKQLTVRAVSKTLGEHFAAFLAANNLNGYMDDPDYVLRDDRVGDILMGIASQPGLKEKRVKDHARKLRDLSGMNYMTCLHLVCRALGYPAWDLAKKYMDTKECYILNMWLHHKQDKSRDVLFNQDKPFTQRDTQKAFKPSLIVETLRHNRTTKLDVKRK